MSDTQKREFAGFNFGLKKDRPDERDYKLFRAAIDINRLPIEKKLEKLLPHPTKPYSMDQKQTGSCVGYSGVQTVYAIMKKNKHYAPFVGSPVFAYREARVLGGNLHEDSGTELRLFWKAMAHRGLARWEDLAPDFGPEHLADRNYIFPSNSVWRRTPAPGVYDSAMKTQAIQYFRLVGVAEAMKSIADGWPFQYGYAVYNSNFDNKGDPLFTIKMPKTGDYIVGYHAVTGYGYSRRTNRFYFRNNWGPNAHQGKPNFSLPFEYVEKYTLDMWTARIIEGGLLINR